MIGATGQFAGLVLPQLKKWGLTVHALVQNQEKGQLRQGRNPLFAAIDRLILAPRTMDHGD